MMKMSAAIALLAASPLAAQDFSLPAGCTAYLTIQGSDCTVTHHFTCERDEAGDKRRADLDEEGLSYVGRVNDEAEWVESFHVRSAHTERLARAADPMSMTELLANGVDTWDFETDSAQIGVSRYVGMDRLTGETVTIDGVELLATEYSLTAYDGEGNEVWSSEGAEYVSRDWRMFLSGISTYDNSNGQFTSDNTPMEFIFPGEAGFLSLNPKHGCGVQMSMMEAFQ